jgi:hypothetical protein
MNIGDQVRALHSSDEGFITKIIDDKTIEIEIEDGFTMPVLIKDVVVVKTEESNFFEKNAGESPQSPKLKKSLADVGIFMAFIPATENFVDLYFVNNTDYTLLLTAHSLEQGEGRGLFHHTILPKTPIQLNKWNIKDFDQWKDLQIDLLYFQNNQTQYKTPLSKKIKFQAKAFFNSSKQVPLLEQKGYLYQVDQQANKTSTKNILTHQSEGVDTIDVPESIIDLHAEHLPHSKNIQSPDILSRQLSLFAQKLDAAIATGMTEITFIHGNGSGVLKSKIQKQLSQHPNVGFYQDAQKNKFGYGATYVKIK